MPPEPRDPEEFDGNLSPATVEAALADRQAGGVARSEVAQARKRRSGRIVRVVSGFLLGQGAAQGVNVLAGLFLVHRLGVEAYAQFGVATGFQTVFSILMDLGFASTIIPLVGSNVDDRALIGRYVRAARHLRDRTFWVLAPIAAVSFLAVVHKRNWSWPAQLLLLASVLLSLYSSGVVGFFSAPLFLRGRLREYYVPQVAGGLGRVIAFELLSTLHVLTAGTAALMAAVNVATNGIFIRRAGLRQVEWPSREDPAADRELLQYVLPALPASIFSAFQSQISLFLISVFGGTLYIAQVSALGRIGQFFVVLTTFNTIVIEPFIARLERGRLIQYFVGFILLSCLACTPLVIIAFLRPQFFIFIIGIKYAGVAPVMGLYVLSSCISFVAGLIWIMNRARKWVFWSGSILEIALVLAAQIAFVVVVGVRTTREAVVFSLASACCVLVAHCYVTLRGFLQKPEAA